MKHLFAVLCIIFVQVGTNLFINPANVLGLKPHPLAGEPFYKNDRTIIIGIDGRYIVSDWDINRIKNALEKEK